MLEDEEDFGDTSITDAVMEMERSHSRAISNQLQAL